MNQRTNNFARQVQERQPQEVRLAREVSHKWRSLKSGVFQFALANQGIGDEKFKWTRITGQPRLGLGHVAVSLSDRGERGGVPQDCKALFFCIDQKAESSHSPSQSWSLRLEIVTGKFAWTVQETGRTFTPEELAQEIAMELTRYHLTYKSQVHKNVAGA